MRKKKRGKAFRLLKCSPRFSLRMVTHVNLIRQQKKSTASFPSICLCVLCTQCSKFEEKKMYRIWILFAISVRFINSPFRSH